MKDDSEQKKGWSEDFIQKIKRIQEEIHDNAVRHGFWSGDRSGAECIALMHSELSEALEAMRKNPNAPDKHCPEFTNVEIELADCIIRILDYAGRKNLRIGEALLAKHDFNWNRPHKHEKKF